MINPLNLVPSWAYALAVAALAGLLVVVVNRDERRIAELKAEHSDKMRDIAEQHDKALQSEIMAHNAAQERIDELRRRAEAYRAEIQASSDRAAAAGARADTAGRRLRDAAATAAVIAGAANQAGATAGQCQAAAEAAGVLSGVLQRIDAAAGRIGTFALGVSRHADEAYAASVECAAISDAGR